VASFRELSEVRIYIMRATDNVCAHALQEMSFGRSGPGEILWKRRNEEIYSRITRANVETAVKYALLGFPWDPVEKGYVLPMLNTDQVDYLKAWVERQDEEQRKRLLTEEQESVLNSAEFKAFKARIETIRRERSVGRGSGDGSAAEGQVDEGLLTEEHED
jgi:hypothetical protein